MKSLIVKRSIILAGHKTSVSLEDAFWQGLKDIATSRRMTLSDLVGSIDSELRGPDSHPVTDEEVCPKSALPWPFSAWNIPPHSGGCRGVRGA